MRRPDVALILIALLIPSLRTGPAFAGDFQDAHEAMREGNWTAAYELLRPLAERGDASAQNDIGFMYCRGLGVPLDHTEAVRWYRKAAEQGDVYSQISLGTMYDLGRCVPQDNVEAAKWYRLAAEQGNATGQLCLATMYDSGRCVPQDNGEAAKWYRMAAEQGNAEAQIHLGFLFENGRGVPRDYVLAHMWYDLAASRFPVSEMENRNRAKKSRDDLASRMTPAQIAEARRLAREWKPGEGKWTPKTR
jgi:hypothetical protein